jgi:translocation and assembly module TamA
MWNRCTGPLLLCVWLASTPARAGVVVEGVEEEVRVNILAVMRLDEEPCDAPRRRIEQASDVALPAIRTALEAFGYYAPRIERSLEFAEDCWTARFDIQLGEPVLLRRVDINVTGDGAGDSAFSALVAAAMLTPGASLRHGRYEKLKTDLSTRALERGYVEARFIQSRIDVYPSELAADVTIEYATGPRYRFGQAQIEQSILHDSFVAAFLDFEPGEYYDNERLVQTRLDLIDSGYFNIVDVRPLPADPESLQIPIAVTLTPAPKRTIGYGLGVSTDTGVRVRFARNVRRFNEAGHQLNFNAMVSPVISEVSANYRLPYGDPRHEWVSFDGGVNREETETSESDRLQLGARRVLRGMSAWERTHYLTLLFEDFTVGEQLGRSTLLMPGIEFLRLRADNAVRPRNGSKFLLEFRGASDYVVSDATFVQAIARTKWIWGLPRASRLLVRTDVGWTKVDDVRDLPPSVRFFAGGDSSVRGYDFQTLGPTNDDGEVIGGSRLLTGSVEIEKAIKRLWSVAAFVDAGNAFEGTRPDLHRGVGIGARWQSPLGPIRVDIAKPQDGSDRGLRLHISLGPDL